MRKKSIETIFHFDIIVFLDVILNTSFVKIHITRLANEKGLSMRNNHILNIPNILAAIRVLLAPLMFLFLVNQSLFESVHPTWLNYTAAFIFVLASATDFFDGYIARTFDQVTVLGSILDPLADKMLTLAGFLGLMMQGVASPWAIYIILTRELFITGLRVSAVSRGLDISASWMGKVKTVVQMIAIGFLLMRWPGGEVLLWIAVFFTLYSGYEYVKEFARSIN
jgi:CDP-diacylglycerol--glycerol-3-phosphate 3-phosphatidyltransferase